MSTNFNKKCQESESFQKIMNHSMQSNHGHGKYIYLTNLRIFIPIFRYFPK